MSDDEIRIAIAESLGWTKCRLVVKGSGAPERLPSPYGIPPGRNYEAPVDDYTRNMNAAVEFVNLLADKKWNCELNNGLDKTWECVFFRIGTDKRHYGPGDTLPRAICEAGLRTLGKWKETKDDDVVKRIQAWITS